MFCNLRCAYSTPNHSGKMSAHARLFWRVTAVRTHLRIDFIGTDDELIPSFTPQATDVLARQFTFRQGETLEPLQRKHFSHSSCFSYEHLHLHLPFICLHLYDDSCKSVSGQRKNTIENKTNRK